MALPESTWLFVFAPALVLMLYFMGDHFAPETVGRLVPAPGGEEVLREIFGRLDAKLEVVAEGYSWVEGPLWVLRPGHEGDAAHGRLLFSDVKRNQIFKLERDGVSRYADVSGCREGPCDQLVEPGSNGLAYNPVEGGVFACEHGSRSVTRLEENGTHTTIAATFQGRRLNSPNDLIFAKNGDMFFTDPTFGLQGLPESARELEHTGVYFVSAADIAEIVAGRRGPIEPTLLYRGLSLPNGIALSPDESTLYVSEFGPTPGLYAFNVEGRRRKAAPAANGSDGGNSRKRIKSLDDILEETDDAGETAADAAASTRDSVALTNARRIFDASSLEGRFRKRFGEENMNGPDGVKVDAAGHVLVAGMCGVHIFSKNGELAGSLVIGKRTGNIGWGGDGFLYVTSDSRILRIGVEAAVLPSVPQHMLDN